MQSKMYEQALPYIESALKIATAAPDAGYQFPTRELYVDALIGLKQLDSAQRVVDEAMARARETRRTVHEAIALGFAADVAAARNDLPAASASLQQAIALGEAAASHVYSLECMLKLPRFTERAAISKRQNVPQNWPLHPHRQVEISGQCRSACKHSRSFRLPEKGMQRPIAHTTAQRLSSIP